MTNYGILTNEDYEVQAMLDKVQKRARVRRADKDDVMAAVRDLDFYLNANDEKNAGLEIQVFMGDYITNYRKNVSDEHRAPVPQMTTTFTLRFNGDGSFTMTDAKRTGHLGYTYYVRECPDTVTLIDVIDAIGAGYEEYKFSKRVQVERNIRQMEEQREIMEYEWMMKQQYEDGLLRKEQEQQELIDELEFWGHGTKSCRSGRHSQIIEDGFTYQARTMNDWDY